MIHLMDDAGWKRATRDQKIQWLHNQIAYREGCTEASILYAPLVQYWLDQYKKRLERLTKVSQSGTEGK